MDLFTALQTSVSGLQAQSYAISNISGNIANSQTTGYKRVDTSFVDMMSETTPKREVAGSVLAQSQLTNTAAAEAGIRDADLAAESANLTKSQILLQAGIAALAQANSAPQQILTLLRS